MKLSPCVHFNCHRSSLSSGGGGGGGLDSRVFVTEAALLYKQRGSKIQSEHVRPTIHPFRAAGGNPAVFRRRSGPVEPATSWFAVTGHSLS